MPKNVTRRGSALKHLTAQIALITALASPAAPAASLMPAGTTLFAGQSITSADGRYRLVMQGDGNLVFYRLADMVPRWNSWTSTGVRADIQNDGNLVVYDQAWAPKWYSSTAGHPGAYVAAQNDGNLVIYLSDGVTPIWWIGADPAATSAPAPAPAPTAYPMINNRPYNSNPPTTFPTSQFWNCTSLGCRR